MRAWPCWLWLSIACSGPSPLAKLTHKQGGVERDLAAAIETWGEASLGASFALGDGVRTLPNASASLELDDTSRLDLGASTTVRFSPTRPAPHTHAFDVQTGAASVQAGEQALSIQTRVGLARVERGSSVLLTPSAAGLRFEVRVGRATFGVSEPLAAGTRVMIDDSGTLTPAGLGDGASSRDALARANLVLADPTGAITATVRGQGASVRVGDDWSPLAEGSSRLALGTELELSSQTSIEIERDGQHALLGENGRYLLVGGDVLVSARSGTVLAGGRQALRVEVPGGMILVPAAGRALVSVAAHETHVVPRALEVMVETGEQRQRVAPGQSAWLTRQGRLRHQAGAPVVDGGPGDAIDFADLVLPGGASATIHDPAPPTAVRFEFGAACAGVGSLELSQGGRRSKRGSGEGGVALSVPKGNHRYAVRCGADTKRVLAGQITVVEDAATRSIASKPPRTALAADGRKYTVLYQNRLPAISLSWPNAPAAPALRLVHEHAGAKVDVALAQPLHEFASGQLVEGQHTFHFEGGGSISRQTSVEIVFDNAAPRASLLLPPVLPQRPGDVVQIGGTALPGSEVWIEGQRVPLDARGRFSGTTALPVERRAVAIKLVQPGRGTHYYLRRGQRP
jgi:hypothetical protein